LFCTLHIKSTGCYRIWLTIAWVFVHIFVTTCDGIGVQFVGARS